MIRYYKLFDLLNRKNMKKSDLREILSSSTVAKLSKGEYISGEAIEKICMFLGCQPGDIMEVVEVTEETNDCFEREQLIKIPVIVRKEEFEEEVTVTEEILCLEKTPGDITVAEADNERLRNREYLNLHEIYEKK